MNKQLGNTEWLSSFDSQVPLVIAGPCSAETPEQLMQIAKSLPSKVKIFRAGIWKPRTRPGGFEGVGAIGLQWMQEVRKEVGLKLATEVAKAEHVDLALKADLDVLWIGARTAVNPFAVQEIADALQGTDKVVLLKNPVNPDLGLWMGGLERLAHANIKHLGAVHRGFSTYEKTKYRNIPEWQIPIDLKTNFPELPVFCDPSHITGDRNRIAEVSQQALDLNYNGLMIETHCNPDQAWSDAAQQVTPDQLKTIIEQLALRNHTDETEYYMSKIAAFRTQLDDIDQKILEAMGRRMAIVDEIGRLKKEKNVMVLQQDRWKTMFDRMMQEGTVKGLTPEFITALYTAMHQESIYRQNQIINSKDQ